jgi:hypothetical protein
MFKRRKMNTEHILSELKDMTIELNLKNGEIKKWQKEKKV